MITERHWQALCWYKEPKEESAIKRNSDGRLDAWYALKDFGKPLTSGELGALMGITTKKASVYIVRLMLDEKVRRGEDKIINGRSQRAYIAE